MGGGHLPKCCLPPHFNQHFKRSLAKWSDKQIPPFYPPFSFNFCVSLLKFRDWLILRCHGASPRIASEIWNVTLWVMCLQMQNVVYDLLPRNSFKSNNNAKKKPHLLRCFKVKRRMWKRSGYFTGAETLKKEQRSDGGVWTQAVLNAIKQHFHPQHVRVVFELQNRICPLSSKGASSLGRLKRCLRDDRRLQCSNTLLFLVGDIPRISLNLCVFFPFSGTWTTLPPSPVRQAWSWTCGRPSTSPTETWMNWLRCWRRWAAATVTSPPWQRTTEPPPPQWLLLTTAEPPRRDLSPLRRRSDAREATETLRSMRSNRRSNRVCTFVFISAMLQCCVRLQGSSHPIKNHNKWSRTTHLKQTKSELHLFFGWFFTQKKD